MRGVLAALLLAGCATSTGTLSGAPGPEELGVAVDCTVETPCNRTEGVWMPAELAVHLAGSELRWRECRKHLEQVDDGPGLKTLGIVCGTCAAAGALTCGSIAGAIK